jgi:TPR repeat protein
MAYQGTGSPERMALKPLSISGSPPQYYGGFQDDLKENIAQPRKAIPHQIPIPDSVRMHGAPMSPVRINLQSEELYPRPSTAKIEGTELPGGDLRKDPAQRLEIRPQTGRSVGGVTLHDSPVRQHFNYEGEDRFPQPQAAVFIGGANSTSSRSEESLELEAPSTKTSAESIAQEPAPTPVPRLQYHHQQHFSDDLRTLTHDREIGGGNRSVNSNPAETGAAINRHLTPNSQFARRSVIPRPASAFSAFSDYAGRTRSPGNIPQSPSWGGGRVPSANSGRSGDARPVSYVDLLNVPYPQPPPVPLTILDNSQLRNAVGSNASLLSTQKTLEMYRMNVKKTNDPSIQYAFAIFLIQAAQEAAMNETDTPSPGRKASPKPARDLDSPYIESAPSSSQDLLREARQILARLADRSYPFAQYYLGDGYASGLFNKGKEDYDRAFPLFIAASKHGHAESGYRAALCYEFGWGSRKDLAKAVQFYRQSASKNHPGAMTRLGRACLSGDLGLNKYREGLKWLKRATESADLQYNAAPYHLGLLYETGYGDDVFLDETYAAQLFTQAADLGHAEASYRLGDAYEHGKLSCPRDPALSVHFYTGAAQAGHPAAMMALCAWYMVGAEPVLEKDENEAYEWARRAAELGKSS